MWLEEAGEDVRRLPPVLRLAIRLPAAGARQRVELCLAVVVGHAPFGGDVAFLLQLQQLRIER